MVAFIARRLIAGLALIFVISFLSYALISLAAPDVAHQILGMNASDAQVAAKQHALGLDQPMVVQYWHWLTAALRGDFGTSWFTSESVASTIMSRLPVTLSLVVVATLVTGIISWALGVAAATRRGVVDRIVQIIGVIGYALPGFLLTLLLVLVFAVQLHWFPAVGYVGLMTSPSQWLASITLPVISLSIGAIAGVSQQVRGSMLGVLDQDYVRTLQARGLSMRRVVFKHALRNASAPALTVLGLQFVGLLGGAVLVEQIFGLPGIGSMAVQYTVQGDIPIIMGLVMFSVVGVVIVNLLVDLLIGWLTPKARVA
ncbi:ABC transporter permease [Branchiibius cervicis]|uniref:ABC transporter permease n=1 Tax=Branchiibius cervicis TaxID=908252 RepID=A0ABW2AWR1_9MICO